MRSLLLVLTLSWFSSSLLPSALAGESLRFNLPVGTTFSFDQSSNFDMSFESNGLSMGQEIVQKLKGTIKVVASEGGVPAQLEIRFDASSGGSMTSSGQTQKQPFSLAGQTVTVRVRGPKILEAKTAAGPILLDDNTRSALQACRSGRWRRFWRPDL